jgi:hypothetical protein
VSLFRSSARPGRRRRLALEPLDGRIVPNGTVVASLSAGVLTLTGDADENVIQDLLVTAGGVTITPDANTQINTAATGTAVPLTGPVTSIKVDLGGGADSLSIDGTSPFSVSGPVSLILGDGNNTLNLVTTGKITLGGLTVTGGDGTDTVAIQGAAGSTIGGTAKFTYGPGVSTTTFDTIAFGGVNLTAGDAAGIGTGNTVTSNNVTVAKTFQASMANSFPSDVDFNASTIGGLKVAGQSVDSVMTATTVNGNISYKAGYSCDIQADGLTVTGNVALTAPNPNIEATGAGTTIGKNLSLSGTGWTNVLFSTNTLSEVKGGVTVKGGWYNDNFEADGNFKVDKNVSLSLNGGDNSVILGDNSSAVTILGNVSIKTGDGNDQVTFDQAAVSGTVAMKLAGGADGLTVEDGSTFAKTFQADLGNGDDTITMAQNPGAANPVTFTGKATITAGAGNDTLFLGLDAADGGDTNSKVVFMDPTSIVDGGTGLNSFDPSTAQFTPTGVVKNW